MRLTSRLSILLFAVSLGACSPHVSSTSAAPKPNAPASMSEDFTLWHTEGMMAPVIHMEMAQAAIGKATISFEKAGALTLVREIPMPGDSVIHLTGTADLDNAAVKAQLWKDGKMLAQRGDGGAVDIAVRSAVAGMAKCVLIFSGNGNGSVSIREAHVSIEKSELSHARIDGAEPKPTY